MEANVVRGSVYNAVAIVLRICLVARKFALPQSSKSYLEQFDSSPFNEFVDHRIEVSLPLTSDSDPPR
jgi:hypothetical protein